MEEEELKELHEKILYPVVRIRTSKAGGSGTIIYSKADPKNQDEYLSFILTNWHVIEGAINYKKEWNSLSEKEILKEVLHDVAVDVFVYTKGGKVISSNTHMGIVIAHGEREDVAVIKLKNTLQPLPWAKLIPEKEVSDITKINRFVPIYLAGCSLLEDPFHTSGEITKVEKVIEGIEYLMYNANSFFGNSGGAVLLKETKEMISIPARITVANLGFGINIIPWMGYGIPPKRIYDFIKKQRLLFLIDESHTYQEYLEEKEWRKKLWTPNSNEKKK